MWFRKLKKLPLRAKHICMECLLGFLGFVERFEKNPEGPLPRTPVFIIGPPRSGSTLLYQCIIEYFDVGYFSNLHHTFYTNPAFVERWIRPFLKREPGKFTSRHGKTEGWLSPSEGGRYWYRFFRKDPQYVSRGEENPREMLAMKKSLRALIGAAGKPMVFKNMPMALRLGPLSKNIPEALYIVASRNEADNALSLLKVRKERHGDYKTWWSMEPPGFLSLKEQPPHVQVVEQIRLIDAVIKKDVKAIGEDRFFHVSYENFIKNPLSILKDMDVFFRKHNLILGLRNVQFPEFSESQSVIDDVGLCERVLDYSAGKSTA